MCETNNTRTPPINLKDFSNVMDSQLVLVHVVHDHGIRLLEVLYTSLYQVPGLLHHRVGIDADNLNRLFPAIRALPLRPAASDFLCFCHSGYRAHLIQLALAERNSKLDVWNMF